VTTPVEARVAAPGSQESRRAVDRRLDDIASTVRRAAVGDEDAWVRLVAAYKPMLLSIAAQFQLPPDLTADLVQVTWLQLFNGITRIRRPETIGAWLAVTMRRICLKAVLVRQRERPVSEFDDWAVWTDLPEQVQVPEARLIQAERAATVRNALAQLPRRQRKLLWYMATKPDASYTDISADLAMPVGAIGPTRARALGRLRRLLLDGDRATILIE
jgi:RNA polymerase sigma factor (sigma-70 family)